MHSSFKNSEHEKKNIFLSVPKPFLTKKARESFFLLEYKSTKSVDFVDKHLAEATQGHFGFQKRSCLINIDQRAYPKLTKQNLVSPYYFSHHQ